MTEKTKFYCKLCKKVHLPACPKCGIRPVGHYPMACDDLDTYCNECSKKEREKYCDHCGEEIFKYEIIARDIKTGKQEVLMKLCNNCVYQVEIAEPDYSGD